MGGVFLMNVLKDYITKEERKMIKHYQKMISEAKTPIGILIYSKKANKLLKKVKKEQEEGMREIVKRLGEPKERQVSSVGDVVKFVDGNMCEVKNLATSGNASINLYYLENQKPIISGEDENKYYGSLRELNYVLRKEKSSIDRVIPTNISKGSATLTVVECHELALDWNRRLNDIR